MNIEASAEHRWLQQLLGEWRYSCEMTCEPGQPPQVAEGSERVRRLGELWVLCEGEGDMPGCGRVQTLMTLGFDPQRGRFVGTWIGSMMTWLWRYDGQLDADRRVLTLASEGPSFTAEGKLANYQDIITLGDEGRRTLDSRVQGEDGEWRPIMTARYTRIG